MTEPEKTRYRRLKTLGARMGMDVRKSRTRLPRIDDHGKWQVIDAAGNVIAGEEWEADLDAVEELLTRLYEHWRQAV